MEQSINKSDMPELERIEKAKVEFKRREEQRNLAFIVKAKQKDAIDRAYKLTGFIIKERWLESELGLIIKRKLSAKQIQQFLLGNKKISLDSNSAICW